MKKKIFGGIAIVAIVAMATFNVNMNTQNENLPDLNLANVEALAQSEDFMTRSCRCKGGSCLVVVGNTVVIVRGWSEC